MIRLPICIAMLASTLLLASCLDPTAVGGGLLDQDQADVGFSDTIPILAATNWKDSTLTYSPFTTSQLNYYLFGTFQDPVFGKASSRIYAQIYPESRTPQFAGAQADSIVLVLPYYRPSFYGKTDEPVAMEVLRLAERLLKDNNYYSNQEIALDPMPLAFAQQVPRPDSVPFYDIIGGQRDTLMLSFFRVPMPLSLAEELLSIDSAVYVNDSLFFEAFKGLCLRPPSSSSNSGMISFDLLSLEATVGRAGLYLFYRDAEGTPRRFQYRFTQATTVRLAGFEHDYSGSKVQPFLNKPPGPDSLVFVQGMAGLEVKLELPDIDKLRGLIVNKAELEVYIATLEGDSPDDYPPIRQLVLSTPNSQGVLEVVEDIQIVQARRLSLPNVFGGVPIGGANGEPMLYKMNISAHFQRVLDGTADNTLYITPVRAGETIARVALYGPGHPQYGMKLKLAFTKL